MSGGIVGALVGALATAAVGVYQGNQQTKASKKAMAQAQRNADAQAKAADEAMNKENQKRPDTSGMLDAASLSGRAGVSGTMLTGAQGVANDQLALGRNALLGG